MSDEFIICIDYEYVDADGVLREGACGTWEELNLPAPTTTTQPDIGPINGPATVKPYCQGSPLECAADRNPVRDCSTGIIDELGNCSPTGSGVQEDPNAWWLICNSAYIYADGSFECVTNQFDPEPIVAVGEPPVLPIQSLPATGSGETAVVLAIAAFFVGIGVFFERISRRRESNVREVEAVYNEVD